MSRTQLAASQLSQNSNDPEALIAALQDIADSLPDLLRQMSINKLVRETMTVSIETALPVLSANLELS